MSAEELRDRVRELVLERPELEPGLEPLMASLERVDVDLDPATAEHLLGLIAETLERRVAIDRASASAERSLASLTASSRRLSQQLETLGAQVQALHARQRTLNQPQLRQYIGPVAQA